MSSKRRYRSNVRKQLDFQRLEPRQLLATLANGQEITSSIGVGGSESFDFQVSQADQVLVSVGDDSSGPAPRLTIFGPDGSEIGTNSSGFDSARLQFIATQSGSYTAVVSENGDDRSLFFQIRALILPGSPELVTGRDQVLSSGDEVAASIPIGGLAVYPLDISSGDQVLVSVGDNSSGPAPRLTIFGPDGSEIGTNSSGFDSARLQFIATQSGSYTAVVSENGDDRSLFFQIRALILPGSPQLVVGRDQALSDGEEIVSSIPIGGLAVYPVNISSGDQVLVSVEDDSSGRAPRLTIFGPDGSEIGTNSSGFDSAQLQFTATQSGIYTAVVSENGNDRGLTFSILATGISQLPPEVIRFRRDGQDIRFPELFFRPDLLDVVEVSFNQDVQVSADDFTFFNETTGTEVQILPQSLIPTFTYDPETFTVTWDFSALRPTLFPPGLYTISAPGITATSDGRPLVESFSQQVLVALPGDANLDGRVDILNDAFALIGNLGTAGGAAWRDGDFNGDGVVDVLNDAFALVGNLGRDLIPAAASASSSTLLAAASLPVERQSAVIVDTASEEDDDKENFQAASRDTVFAGEQEYLVLA